MPELVYGVWDKVPFDTRKGTAGLPKDLPLEAFSSFNEGNPISILLSERGFLVFDPSVSLLGALQKHFNKVASESCGKCSPCRTGAALLNRALTKALSSETFEQWDMVRELAEQMATTSLCGIGQTGPVPLLNALEFFPEELEKKTQANQGGFYSVMTSPCIEACPGLVNIPRYLDYIKDGHFDLSASAVLRHYPLVGSCGRVCVRSCEAACKRGKVDQPISIRNLKRFAADEALASGLLKAQPCKLDRKERVAVVGAGPVGLACAYHLLALGYPVEIFEEREEAGGMIRYGIPIYRLPKETLSEEVAIVTTMGAKINYGQALGRDFDVAGLVDKGFSAVFIACGCPEGTYLGMEGEDTSLPGYENGLEFLDRVYEGVRKNQPPTLEGDVVVVGGGNVAMDCCRAAVRVAKGKVHLIYRRTEADAPADAEEIAAAKAEGVEFHFLCGQKSLAVNAGQITGLVVQEMVQTEPDASGRRGVKPREGSEHTLPCAHVIAAIGQKTSAKMLSEKDGIERDRKNCIVVNSAQETSRAGVFAAGDCTAGPRSQGPSTMIMGMGQAYFAARSIHRYLAKQDSSFDARYRMSELIKNAKLMKQDEAVAAKIPAKRVALTELDAQSRSHNFAEVEQTMSKEEAFKEAARCLRCYRIYSVGTAKPVPSGE